MKIGTKRATFIRYTAILTVFAIAAAYLLSVIFRLSVFENEYYRNKTHEQITTSTVLRAKRGEIYDCNMNLLAKSGNVWRIFVSPVQIKKAEKENGRDLRTLISDGLSEILGIDKEDIYEKISRSHVLDVTVKKSASEEEYSKVISFIGENGLSELVFTEQGNSRYYPEGTLAAHLLGFVGSDNQGLYGLEYQYDSILSGIDGYYVYAKDANGLELDTEYSSYVPATDGASLITTIDSYIQSELEAVIESARVNHKAENRVCGIVMDTKTGAILAMATTSPFDPNSPFELDSVSEEKLSLSGLTVGSEEYKKYRTELMQIMWSNKAVSEIYEPGSTFKILTVSAALDSGVAKITDSFSCKGYAEVGGWKIRCHKAGGHGSGFSLAYGLQMSCNPCMIAISERLGAEAFYSYVKSFGLLNKTGIDLPSEAGSIFHSPESIGPTELATASFGQRFKVSVINLLTAIACVANGGNKVTPYLVDKIVNSDGTVAYTHKPSVGASVISKDVAKAVTQILVEGVSGNGGAKNAAVVGYDIAAKTGTSQKFDILDENGNSYLRIGSTVAYATDEEKGIATIIVVDEPDSQVKYGSVVAAPYVSRLLENILPYLEFRSERTEKSVALGNYVGLTVDAAKARLRSEGISYTVIGDGNYVLRQSPAPDEEIIAELGRVILYTKDESDQVTVPRLTGKSLSEAIKIATEAGLNVKISGRGQGLPDGNSFVIEQSIPEGTVTKRGEIITLLAPSTDFED